MPRVALLATTILVVGLARAEGAGARGVMQRCRQECSTAIAACVKEGIASGTRSARSVRRRCRKQTLRRCKREGVDTCVVASTTTTTTLHGQPGSCVAFTPSGPCNPTAEVFFSASTGSCCIVDSCANRVYGPGDAATNGVALNVAEGDVEYGCGSAGLQLGTGAQPQQPPSVLDDGSRLFQLPAEDIGWGPVAITLIPHADDPFWTLLDASIVLHRTCGPLEEVLASAVVTFKRDDGTLCDVRSYMTTRRHP